MSQKHTLNELNTLSRDELITIILTMQGQLDALNENVEKAHRAGTDCQPTPFRAQHGNREVH